MKLRYNGPRDAARTLVLAHGAGAAMDSPFMTAFASAVGKRDIRVVRFEFPYMQARRSDGKKRPPDRESVLRDSWRQLIDQLGSRTLVIGGKSLGGRMASLVADEADVHGLVCLGYPFHPVGRRDKLRIDHLKTMRTSTLILQGERDAFGNRDEVNTYDLAPAVEVCWLTDGDHDFKPRKASGLTQQENWHAAQARIVDFVHSLAD